MLTTDLPTTDRPATDLATIAVPRQTPAQPSVSPFRALVDWYRRQRTIHELAALDAGAAARLADDLKVSVEDLVAAASQSADEIALMERMLRLHGLDPDGLKADMPGLIREMAVTCAKCDSKGECRFDLDHGITAPEADEFCPNADTMNALAMPQA